MSNDHVHPIFQPLLKGFEPKAKRHKAAPGECAFCDAERADGNNYHPSHDASDLCESGKHNHCTCDTCF